MSFAYLCPRFCRLIPLVECVDTVSSLFEAASRPHLIYVGVILQDVFPSAIEANMLELRIPRIRLLHMYYQRARGPGYARSLGAQLYAGEDYWLNIDSHTRFVKNWWFSKPYTHQCTLTRCKRNRSHVRSMK